MEVAMKNRNMRELLGGAVTLVLTVGAVSFGVARPALAQIHEGQVATVNGHFACNCSLTGNSCFCVGGS